MRAAEALSPLNALVAEIVDLRHAAALVGWDERVCMPAGGVQAHGDMLATIQRIAHDRLVSDELGRALDLAAAGVEELPADADERRLVRVTRREYERAVRVPSSFVAEYARATSTAHQAWKDAREASDFAVFEPHLEKIVGLEQRFCEFFAPVAHPYDALLDTYEPGVTTAQVQAIFSELRPRQVALVRAIQRQPPCDTSFLTGAYSESDMIAFARSVIEAFGFDWGRGRQDTSAHPFAIPLGSDDVRITTRFDHRTPFETLFSTMHEAGHALYEQGVAPVWNRTLARGGASLGVHESQSRLWENLIGRSLPFWEHFYPALQQVFRAQLAGVPLDRFHRGINAVRPSLIRVEADEVTYNLHVMLRVEMEIALLSGEVSVHDAPEAWNAKMADYLGVVPADASTGILQDMHWSIGLFGYFATYTLGNLMSVQLWDQFRQETPDWADQLRAGHFLPLREWLRTALHQHGRSYRPAELVERITGGPLATAPYLDYLESKYSALYGLEPRRRS